MCIRWLPFEVSVWMRVVMKAESASDRTVRCCSGVSSRNIHDIQRQELWAVSTGTVPEPERSSQLWDLSSWHWHSHCRLQQSGTMSRYKGSGVLLHWTTLCWNNSLQNVLCLIFFPHHDQLAICQTDIVLGFCMFCFIFVSVWCLYV